MAPYRLRPAAVDDADALFRIHRASMGEYLTQALGPWTDDFAREQHNMWLRAGRAQVVMVGDQIAGAVDIEWRPEMARLNRIEIAPQFQGHGVDSAGGLVGGPVSWARWRAS
jgi:hypothetical protein